jgi:hypothetical protein
MGGSDWVMDLCHSSADAGIFVDLNQATAASPGRIAIR